MAWQEGGKAHLSRRVGSALAILPNGGWSLTRVANRFHVVE